jgi:hypothetical protein
VVDDGLHLCGGTEHSGFDKALAGLVDAGSAGGLKACRRG